MKRMPLLLLVVLLLCVTMTAQALEISPVQETDSGFVTADGEAYQIPAETEGYFIPGFTCYPVQCGNFAFLLPMEWECFATDPGYPAVVAVTPDEGMLMVAEFGAEMDPLSAKDHYAASFLQEGRDLFAGKTTEDSKLLDTFLLDGLPALQVETEPMSAPGVRKVAPLTDEDGSQMTDLLLFDGATYLMRQQNTDPGSYPKAGAGRSGHHDSPKRCRGC